MSFSRLPICPGDNIIGLGLADWNDHPQISPNLPLQIAAYMRESRLYQDRHSHFGLKLLNEPHLHKVKPRRLTVGHAKVGRIDAFNGTSRCTQAMYVSVPAWNRIFCLSVTSCDSL